jgi:hypothetical protein
MAISRSQISRQLQNRGGITNISPRQNFGLGSKLKRFVRKVIPNEVSKVASAAAPFVAPFNPALAGAMAGIGSFDQTGSLSDAFKRGALTYGGGQAARYIGGAGFQGNPFAQGGAFTPAGFTSGFSSPIGTETGLGKFFSKPNAPISEVQPVGIEASEGALTGKSTPTFRESMADINLRRGTTDTSNIITPGYDDMLPNLYETASNVGPSINVIKAETITKDPSFISSVVDKFQNQDYAGVGGEVLNAAKKVGKEVFYKDGKLDKPVVLGTAAFALSFAEAKAIANEAGIDDYTEAQYDEDQKAEKKAEYANYLTNFFAGKKEGGRIGFAGGTSKNVLGPARKAYNSVYGYDAAGNKVLVKDLYDDFESFLEMFKMSYHATGGRVGFAEGSEDMTIIEKIKDFAGGAVEKLGEEAMYKFNEFVYNEPALYGYMANNYDADTLQNPKAREEIRTFYDKLSPKKQEYIEMYLDSIAYPDDDSYKDWLFSKPSKISFPTDERMEEHNKQYDFLPYGKDAYSIRAKTDKDLPKFMKADGGRINYANGTEDMTMIETLTEDPFAEGVKQMYVSDEMGALPKLMKDGEAGVLPSDMGILSRADFETEEDYNRYLQALTKISERDMEAEGGRQGFFAGMLVKEGIKKLGKIIFSPAEKTFLFKNLGKLGGADRSQTFPNLYKILKDPSKFPKDAKALKAFIELRMKKKEGGLSSIPVRTNEAGVKELDMRSSGGFVPIGVKEKADDVPAMLSKNEFVLTADAVRGIGGGSVEKGSEKLYNMMKQAEQVGKA